MLKSMTGFGRSEGETALGRVSMEIRSVNHRFCDVTLKLPRRLSPFENRIKEMVRSSILRGKIDVAIRLDSSGEGKVRFDVDSALAQQYFSALQTLKETLRLSGEVTLDMVAGVKDIITAKEESEDVESCWNDMAAVVQQSIRQIDEMKRLEGEVLTRDIEQRFKGIFHQLQEVKEQFPKAFDAYRSRFRERLQSLLQGTELDLSRFEQEMALLADRMDITEEIVRAESHLAQVAQVMNQEETVGRKMEFLIQEINREVNTISNKANDAGISQRIVVIKSELEKIREQVQNIE